jgi:hypothetical protein
MKIEPINFGCESKNKETLSRQNPLKPEFGVGVGVSL